MELIAGYKQTEIGVVPEDWDVKPLSEVLARARLGGNYPNQDAESDFPLMKMGNIARGAFDVSEIEYISPSSAPEAQHRLATGDVLFNTRNTLDLVGKVAIWRDELPFAYYNSNLLRLEFKPSDIASSVYANYWLNTATAVSNLRALATGTTSVAAIYTRDLLGFLIAVPPSSEQAAIATSLSDVDALLAAQDALIAKKRAIKQGAMQELLTGKRRLPGFSGEWGVRSLGNFGACYRGVSYDPTTDLFLGDAHESVRLLRANNVQDSSIDLEGLQFVRNDRVAERQSLRHGDVLICMANGSKDLVGKAARFTLADGMRYTFGAFMGCYRPDPAKVSPVFSFYLFQTDAYRLHLANLLAGSSINNLAPKSIEGLEIAIPLQEAEQDAIAEVLSDMDTEITALEASRAKTAQLKQGMMQALLTGRIRLV